jgi:23S rRNA (adenine2030-N6)-methyltransferase
LLGKALLRRQDRLIACELEPQAAAALQNELAGDARAKVIAIDGWTALTAYVPPVERRGVVLIDPPFEEARELDRMAEGLAQGLQRFATGIYLAWYPIKDLKPIARFHADLAALGIPKLMRVELLIQRPSDSERLNGCGLIVANPPYTLEGELSAILPELSRRLASASAGARYRLDWIEPTKSDLRKPSAGAKQRVRPTR